MKTKEDFLSNAGKLASLQQLLSTINPVEAAKALLANTLVAGSIRQAVLAMKDEDRISVYQCNRCAYGSHNYAEWSYHSRTHDNDAWCGMCDYRAANQQDLSNHQHYHTTTLKFKCTLCPYLTCTQLSLSDHIHLVHRTVYAVTCDTCGYRTNGGSTVLNMHKSVHTFMNHRLSDLFSGPQVNGCTGDGGLEDMVVLKVEPVEMEGSARGGESDNQSLDAASHVGKVERSLEKKRSNRRPWWDTQTEIAPPAPTTDEDRLKPKKPSQCTFCGLYYNGNLLEHQCRVVRPALTVSTLYCSACSFETTDRKSLTEHYVTLHSRCWKSLVIQVTSDFASLESMCNSLESLIPNRLKHLADNLLVMRMDGGSVAACVSSATVCLFRCTKCFNTFTSLDLQAGHKLLDQCMPVSRPYQFGCNVCNVELPSAEEGIDHHLKCHTTIKSVRADPKVAGSEGNNAAEDALLMVEALQKVGVERNAENLSTTVEVQMMPGMCEMSCHLCSYVSDESDKYNDHLFSQHWGFLSDTTQETHKVNMATVYGCNLCSFICEQTKTLSLHMATHAAPRRTLNKKKSNTSSGKPIPECMATDSTGNTAAISSSISIPSSLSSCTLQCTSCGFQTDSKSSLRLHTLQHKDDKPRYKCEQCSFSTAHSSTLTIHMRSHTGYKPFVCSMCGKGFTSNSELRKHERRHAGLVEKKFLCEICNKSYSTPQHLKVHQRRHTGDRPFKCEFCPFAATSKCVLINHRTTHTGEKNYKCHMCPFSCASSGTLSNHRRLKHNIVNKRKTLAETTPESIILAARVAGKSKGVKPGSNGASLSATASVMSSGGQVEQSAASDVATPQSLPLTSATRLPAPMTATEQVYEIIQTGTCDFQMVSDTASGH